MHVRTLSPALLALALVAACGGSGGDAGDAGMATDSAAGSAQAAAPAAGADSMSIQGFQTPESVLYDDAADVYYVSNINGNPLDKDGNGFISRVSPDGTIAQERFVDGASEGVTLNGPKGLAIHGDTLFVADIDVVRAFDRNSGKPLADMPVSGATFLNDLAVAPDGTLYVTDSGLDASFNGTGTDAVYRFEGGKAVAVSRDSALLHPNGILVSGDSLVIVPFGGNVVLSMARSGGAISKGATLPGGQLDGVVRLGDGSLLVSSWEGQAVYRVPGGGGAPSVAVSGVESPADIGYDAGRGRLLIPIFQGGRVEVRGVR